MENNLNSRFVLLVSMAVILASCSKKEEMAGTANQRFIQSMDWNSNHSYSEIKVPADDYKILSMGDSHVGGTKNLDSFFDMARSKKATAVVMAGDLTTGKEKDYEVFEQHLETHDSIPAFLVTGNHDLFFNGWNRFYSWFGSSTYLFTVQTPAATDLFICLETGGGTLGTRQLDWLTSLLQTKRSGYRHCIVFTHNNILRTRHTDSTNPEVEEVEILLELFARYDVDMVITGHDHKHDVTIFGNTTYITMDALKDGEDNAGYFQIKTINGNISYEFEHF